MSPTEIKSIRERLGLSQDEAGKILGGGPRAFAKYEAGTIKPAAAVVNLLRLLDADPSAIATLRGEGRQKTMAGGQLPFEVSETDIGLLNERTLPALLRRLLHAEASMHSLPLDGIHISSEIHSPDGGEDGRIIWRGGAARTPFLPSRRNQFQLKAGKIFPKQAALEVVSRSGAIKPAVRSFLEHGGHYIMICTKSYTQKQIDDRGSSIHEAIQAAGVNINDDQVNFREATQLAMWVNNHPAVAIWLKERVHPDNIGPFRSWSHWAGRAEHAQMPWIEDDRFPPFGARLREILNAPRSIVRVVGLSGIGKSRLTLEALGTRLGIDVADRLRSDTVMYAVQSDSGVETINSVVQNIAEMGMRAIVVVDHCEPKTRRILEGIVLRESSRLSLVTIEDESPTGRPDDNTLEIYGAPDSLTDAIIDRVSPGLQSEDKRRIAFFSKGFPKITVRLGKIWGSGMPITHSDDDMVDVYVVGRSSQNPDFLLGSAKLLAAFGLVDVERFPDEQLAEVANLSGRLSVDELNTAISELVSQGIARKIGGLVTIQPRWISMTLAERQWREWSHAKWDEVLAGDTDSDLKVPAARQLARINTADISRQVVKHVCRYGGPYDDFKRILKPGNVEVLSELAEIDPERVALQIDRSLSCVDDLRLVQGNVRRHLVRAAEKTAFCSESFRDGARLLLRLAVSENEMWSNNATGLFISLFPVMLGNTAAGGEARLQMLDEAIGTNNSEQQVIAVKALVAGSETHHFTRVVGAEVQGSKPAMDSWLPATNEEALCYVSECVSRLAELSLNEDEAGATARSALGQTLGSLILMDLIETVEEVVHRVGTRKGYWREAVISLRSFLKYDAGDFPPESADRVQKLIDKVEPKSLEERLRSLVIETPWGYYHSDENLDRETVHRRRVEEIRDLAKELLNQPNVLMNQLSRLTREPLGMAQPLGEAIAVADESMLWLESIIEAIAAASENERDYDLLTGYIAGLVKVRPEEAEALKQRVAAAPELAPAIPQICSRLGVTSADIQLAIGCLQSGWLPPWRFRSWEPSNTFAQVNDRKIAPLLDVMLEHSLEGFIEALALMDTFCFHDIEKLEELRPQVLHLAKSATKWWRSPARQLSNTDMITYEFQRIIGWILDKGREDSDARATAFELSMALATVEEYQEKGLLKPAVPMLLSNFPEIVLPFITLAIETDYSRVFLLKHILGNPFELHHEKETAVLSLSNDTLFAWCHANPNSIPAFVASFLPILTAEQPGDSEQGLHPVMVRLIDEFGEREDVQEAIVSNMHNFSWRGSRTHYYARYEEPIGKVLQHPNPKISYWARGVLRHLRDSRETARRQEEERTARWEV